MPTETHPCAQACAYGTCGVGRSSSNACGGCCACTGPCVVDFEDAQAVAAGSPAPGYDPISRHRTVEAVNV